jgi:modulator of FtsH protease
MVSGKSFSFLGSFLFTGLIIVVILSLVQIFWHPAFLQVIVAGMGALVFSGLILFDTARILSSSEEEMTPVMAVVSLYLDVLNLFLSLLRILEIFRGRD